MTGQRARFPAVAGRVGHYESFFLKRAVPAAGWRCGSATPSASRRGRPGTDPLALELPGGAAYERGMRERDHGVPLQPFADG